MFVMRSVNNCYNELKSLDGSLAFGQCQLCGTNTRAAQVCAALNRCRGRPGGEPNRNVSFMRVWDNGEISKLGVVALLDRTAGNVAEDMRAGSKQLHSTAHLVGFWIGEGACRDVGYVHVGGHTAALNNELRLATHSDIAAHTGSKCALERAAYWSSRYDEVVVDRLTLPDEAWQRKWSDIPPKAIEEARRLMSQYTADPDKITDAFWDRAVAFIFGQVMGISPAPTMTSTELDGWI